MKRTIIIILLLALMLPLVGCWDKRELDSLALVVGVGLDSLPDNKLRLTVELAEREGSGAAKSRLISVEAESLEAAEQQLSLALENTPYWGGVALVVIGAGVTEQEARHWCQCLYRISWFSGETPVVKAHISAEQAYTHGFGEADYVSQGVAQALAYAAKDSDGEVHTLFDEVEQGMNNLGIQGRPQLNEDEAGNLKLE